MAITNWHYQFGDGFESTEQNPVHEYKMAGSYTVTLTVTNDDGSTDTFVRTAYISVSDTDFLIDGKSVNRPNLTYRFAVKPTKGRGWTKYEGDYPLPDVRTGVLKLFDEKNQLRQLVYDSDDRKYYEIGLRKGPENSGLDLVYKDKYGTAYGGSSIPCEIHFAEDRAEEEHMPIDHLESHVYFRPQDDDDIGAEGHDASGYLEGLEVDMAMRIDGAVEDNALTQNIPKTGDMTYDKRVDGRRLQPIVRMSESSWKLTGLDHYYNRKNKSGTRAERTMSEQDWQAEYGQIIAWATRYKTPMTNLASGVDFGGSYGSLVTGPDGLSESAYSFAGAEGLTQADIELDDDFTMQFGLKDILNDTDIVEIGDFKIEIQVTGTTFELDIQKGSLGVSQTLNWNGEGWVILKVSRSGDNIIVSEDGEILNTLSFGYDDIAGTMNIMVNQTGDLFDFRLYQKNISNDGFAYYYRNLNNDSGNALLPLY